MVVLALVGSLAVAAIAAVAPDSSLAEGRIQRTLVGTKASVPGGIRDAEAGDCSSMVLSLEYGSGSPLLRLESLVHELIAHAWSACKRSTLTVW